MEDLDADATSAVTDEARLRRSLAIDREEPAGAPASVSYAGCSRRKAYPVMRKNPVTCAGQARYGGQLADGLVVAVADA